MKGKIENIEKLETRKGNPYHRITINYKEFESQNPISRAFNNFRQLSPEIEEGADVDFTFKSKESSTPGVFWYNITSIRKSESQEPDKEKISGYIEKPQVEYTTEEKVDLLIKQTNDIKDLLLRIAEKNSVDVNEFKTTG